MKRLQYLIFVLPFFLSLTVIISAVPVQGKEKAASVSKHSMDITGDGKSDYISITGVKAGWNNYERLLVKIKGSDRKHYQIKLGAGPKPKLVFVDFTHDGVKDIFINIPVSGKDKSFKHKVFSFCNSEITKLNLPDPLLVESGFVDGYKADLKIKNTGNRYLLDLKDRQKYYEKLGIFYKGKLNEPTELMVSTYGELKPVLLKGEKTGLKGIQTVRGASDADEISFVESYWSYEESRWQLKKVKVLKINNS
jgi:hypothetical protein